MRSGVYKHSVSDSRNYTYSTGGLERSLLGGGSLLHYHRVVVSTGWDHHGRVRVATVHTFVKHDVLGVVLAEENRRVSLNSGWGLQFHLSATGSLEYGFLSEPRPCTDA